MNNELYEVYEHLQKAQQGLQKMMNGGGQMGQRNNSGSMGNYNNGSGGNYNQREGMPAWLIQKMMQHGGNPGGFEGYNPAW